MRRRIQRPWSFIFRLSTTEFRISPLDSSLTPLVRRRRQCCSSVHQKTSPRGTIRNRPAIGCSIAMAEVPVLRGEASWLSDLADEYLKGQTSFDVPLGEGQDPFSPDELLLPQLMSPISSEESTVSQHEGAYFICARACQTRTSSGTRLLAGCMGILITALACSPARPPRSCFGRCWTSRRNARESRALAGTCFVNVPSQGSRAKPPPSAGLSVQHCDLGAYALLPQTPGQSSELNPGPFPPSGYVLQHHTAPQVEQPSLRQLSAGDAFVDSGDHWSGYDANGSSGHLNSSGNAGTSGNSLQSMSEVRPLSL